MVSPGIPHHRYMLGLLGSLPRAEEHAGVLTIWYLILPTELHGENYYVILQK